MGGAGCVGVLRVVVEVAEVGSLMMKEESSALDKNISESQKYFSWTEIIDLEDRELEEKPEEGDRD